MNDDDDRSGKGDIDGSRVERYAEIYANAFEQDFEKILVHYRQLSVIDYLKVRKPNVIVEVGCGLDLLVTAAAKEGLQFQHWSIIEPTSQFADLARKETSRSANIRVLEAQFEKQASPLDLMQGTVDLVIMSSILHEVAHPEKMLTRARQVLKMGGTIFAIVPSATSLHRRLASTMGLIDDLRSMSERNHLLMQSRVFDRSSLTELFLTSFEVVDSGGLFIKPFTHKQMMSCTPHLSNEIFSGLWKLGRELPDLACEIFVEARKTQEAAFADV